MRTLAVSLLAFMLLSPIFRQLQRTEIKPVVAILQDNTASQKAAFKTINQSKYQKDFKELVRKLRDDFKVETYNYGDNLNDSLKFQYKDNISDISGNLETLISSHDHENLACVILSGDGIYNRGANPAYQSSNFQGSIYTIGVGDTNVQRDATVARAFANKVVYLGDKFSIRSDVAVYAGQGRNLSVSIYSHSSGRVVASKSFNVNSPRFSSSIESVIDANSPGMHRYSIRVSKMDGEQNLANNVQDVFVQVLDNKEKILLLANSPHPDIAAIRSALTTNKNYKLSVQTAGESSVRVGDYNLIILHNLPSPQFNANSIIQEAKRLGVSLWFIAGRQSMLPALNKAQNAMQIQARSSAPSAAMPILNTNFSYFNLKNKASMDYPPLIAPFGSFKAGPNSQTLLTQKIGAVKTDNPMLVMQNGSRGKSAVLAGEGIWQWRMYDYRKNQNYKQVDELISKTVQFLSVKQDRRKFRISTQRTVFNETEAIIFDAEMYNENYELINSSDVRLNISDANGKVYKHSLNKNGNSYSLNVGSLSAGKYSYSAAGAYNGRSMKGSGSFTVIEQNIEEVNTTADFGLLNQLAQDNNGEFVHAQNLSTLYDKIKKNTEIKSLLRSQLNTFPLIDRKWIFALIALLLALEWFLRKRFGTY